MGFKREYMELTPAGVVAAFSIAPIRNTFGA